MRSMQPVFLFLVIVSLVNICFSRPHKAAVVVGVWGGDGKGKIIDVLNKDIDVVVLAQGGVENGHSILFDNQLFNCVMVPEGILRPNIQCYLTAGVMLDVDIFLKEVDSLKKRGIEVIDRLWISASAHVVMPWHKVLDTLSNQKLIKSIKGLYFSGSGVHACHAAKFNGVGIRVADIMNIDCPDSIIKNALIQANKIIQSHGGKPFKLDEISILCKKYACKLKQFVKEDVELEINKLLMHGKRVIFIGSQGAFADRNLGAYPCVAFSGTLAGSICSSAGVGPTKIAHTLAVVTSYVARVDDGPFPTEIKNSSIITMLNHEKQIDFISHNEQCRFGWIDMVMVRWAVYCNGVDSIAISKLDKLTGLKEIKICIDYEDPFTGLKYDYLPPQLSIARKLRPIYITMNGWQQDITQITKFSDLPEEARAFVKRIEVLSGVPISYVSVGPDRKQVICMNGFSLF